MPGEAVLILKAIIDDYADKMAKMQAMNDKLMAQVGQLVQQTEKGSAAEIAMGNAAKRVLDEIRTPAEHYARQMRELNTLLEKGKLSQEEYGRAAAKAKDTQPASGLGGWARGELGHIAGLVTGYLSISKVIEVVTEGYRRWAEQVKRNIELSDKLNTSMVTGLTNSALAMQAPEVEKWVDTAAAQGRGTREQAQTAIFSVSEAAPTASLARKQELAEQVLLHGPQVGGKPAEMAKYGGTLGELAKVMPGKTGGDVADVMQSLQQRMGKDAEQLLSRPLLAGVQALVETKAATPEEALGLARQMVELKMSPKLLETLAGKLNEPMQVKTRRPGHKKLTPAEIASNRFASEPDARKRFEMIVGDQEVQMAVGGEKMAGRISGREQRITMASIQTEAGVLGKAQKEDFARQSREKIAGTKAGLDVLQDQAHAVEMDQKKMARAEIDDAWKKADQAWEKRGAGRDLGGTIGATITEWTERGAAHLLPGKTEEEQAGMSRAMARAPVISPFGSFRSFSAPLIEEEQRQRKKAGSEAQVAGSPSAINAPVQQEAAAPVIAPFIEKEPRQQGKAGSEPQTPGFPNVANVPTQQAAASDDRRLQLAEQQLEATKKLLAAQEATNKLLADQAKQARKPSDAAVQNNRTAHRES